jgi:hypothetical protein
MIKRAKEGEGRGGETGRGSRKKHVTSELIVEN